MREDYDTGTYSSLFALRPFSCD